MTELPRAQTSDPSAWVDLHGDVLFRYAAARVRDPAVAEELVQETFLAALRARGEFAGRSSEQTWLVSILRRKIVDFFRGRAKGEAATSSDEGDWFSELYFDRTGHWKQTPPHWGPEAAGALEQSEFWRVLDDCLAKLPGPMGAAFCLRELEQVDTGGICKILGMTASNLWTQLHRARMLLRTCLERNWFVPPHRPRNQ